MWPLRRLSVRATRRLTANAVSRRSLTSASIHTTPISQASPSSLMSTSQAPLPLLHFNLDGLPPQLQREFDVVANERALRHLARKANTKRLKSTQTLPTARSVVTATSPPSSEPAELCITSSTVHPVMWRCEACHTQWSARPSERANPQTADAYRCPCCYGDATPPPAATLRDAPLAEKSAAPSVPTAHVSNLLCEVHPALAAQWDTHRNGLLQNSVLQDVTEVHTSSSTKAWWQCPLCRTPWLEAVSSRVARFEMATQAAAAVSKSASSPDVSALVCPACERRGVSRRAGSVASAAQGASQSTTKSSMAKPRRWLSDDPLLLSEALLRPAQNPREISLTGETMLQWRCRTCQFEYGATVANRFLRHERCPQCSGKEKSMMNLLVIQRPDVVQEVSKHISRTRLRYVTVHDDVELPFVCRTCFSPYRMTARVRCAVPRGVPVCPKCFLTSSQVLAEAQQHAMKAGMTQLTLPARRRVQKKALQLSRSNRSADRLATAANELRHRDNAMKD